MKRFSPAVIAAILGLGISCRAGETSDTSGPAGRPPSLSGKQELAGRTEQWAYVINQKQYTWYLKPNTFYINRGIIYETNSLGLRDVEFPVEKPAGSLRIVCLGDSVTYGAGVAFDQTYEQQLERKLRARRMQVKVINAGIGSQRAWQGLARLDQDVLRFSPDIVTICFGTNDGSLAPQTLWQEWKDRLKHGTPSSPTLKREEISDDSLADGEAGLVPNVPIDQYAGHLGLLVTQVRRRSGARVYLLVFSSIGENYNRSTWSDGLRQRQRAVYRKYQERVLQVGAETGAKVVEVGRGFEQSVQPPYAQDGIHPNAWGQKIYAEALFQAITADLSSKKNR